MGGKRVHEGRVNSENLFQLKDVEFDSLKYKYRRRRHVSCESFMSGQKKKICNANKNNNIYKRSFLFRLIKIEQE